MLILDYPNPNLTYAFLSPSSGSRLLKSSTPIIRYQLNRRQIQLFSNRGITMITIFNFPKIFAQIEQHPRSFETLSSEVFTASVQKMKLGDPLARYRLWFRARDHSPHGGLHSNLVSFIWIGNRFLAYQNTDT